MPTIYDIAKAAGVSHTTVSRVMNANGYVKDETRERILKVVQELGYYPNELARGLVNRRTRTVALLVSDVTNPYFTTIARGAEDVASSHGYSIVLCNTDESLEKEKSYIDLVLRKQFDGVLLASAAPDGLHLEGLLAARVPLVLLDRKVKGVRADVVRADGYSGARSSCDHFTAAGHKRIALFSGPLYIGVMSERLSGYSDALEAAGLAFDSALVFSGEPRFEVGYGLAKHILQQPQPPTAILCTNSSIGLGAYAALQESKVRVPEDVAIVVFDFEGVDMYSRAFPFIASVSQPAYELGTCGMEYLLQRVEGNWGGGVPPEPREKVFPTSLVVRASG